MPAHLRGLDVSCRACRLGLYSLGRMNIVLHGMAGPAGWPAPECRCASCSRLRAEGVRHEPTRVVIDGVPLEECSRWEVPGGFDVYAPGGDRLLVAGGPGQCPEPVPDTAYDAVLLDLTERPEHLGLLRHRGAVTAATEIWAVHADHRISSPRELERRLSWWRHPRSGPWRTLLLGGARSGKSAEAELRLAADPHVTYVATGMLREDDPEWTARIETHRERRPSWWRTVETLDVARALRMASGSVLVDGIGTWLAATMDACGAWEDLRAVRPAIDELVEAWRNTRARVVAVSDEVGLSLVPTSSSGRAFRDALGRLNQQLATESEETALIVAGRIMELP